MVARTSDYSRGVPSQAPGGVPPFNGGLNLPPPIAVRYGSPRSPFPGHVSHRFFNLHFERFFKVFGTKFGSFFHVFFTLFESRFWIDFYMLFHRFVDRFSSWQFLGDTYSTAWIQWFAYSHLLLRPLFSNGKSTNSDIVFYVVSNRI